jgi:hypothetical protein
MLIAGHGTCGQSWMSTPRTTTTTARTEPRICGRRLRRHHHSRVHRLDGGENTAAEGLGRIDQRVRTGSVKAISPAMTLQITGHDTVMEP